MAYILFEGIDGSGKDTQADLLLTRLANGHNSRLLRVAEPCEDLPHGRLLRQLLVSGDHPESHAALFLADRIALQYSTILPHLQGGGVVISTRSFLSTLVYQREQWPLDWLKDLHRTLPAKPDAIVYLDIDPEEGLARVGQRDCAPEFYEKAETLQEAARRYRELMSDPLDGLVSKQCLKVTVDASQSRSGVFQDVWDALSPLVSS